MESEHSGPSTCCPRQLRRLLTDRTVATLAQSVEMQHLLTKKQNNEHIHCRLKNGFRRLGNQVSRRSSEYSHEQRSLRTSPSLTRRRYKRRKTERVTERANEPLYTSETLHQKELSEEGRLACQSAQHESSLREQTLAEDGTQYNGCSETESSSPMINQIPPHSDRSLEDTCAKGKLEKAVQMILETLPVGNVSKEALAQTPARFAEALTFLTSGYRQTVKEVIAGGVFDAGMMRNNVVVRDIDVCSLCEHHLLPFSGKCHIGYLPGVHLLGLSKLARIVDVFARRLQLQERLTQQVASAVEEAAAPRGVAIAIECTHCCMTMRGVSRPNSTTTTTAFTGLYAKDESLRREFLTLIGVNRN